jgi:hypothetical protein
MGGHTPQSGIFHQCIPRQVASGLILSQGCKGRSDHGDCEGRLRGTDGKLTIYRTTTAQPAKRHYKGYVPSVTPRQSGTEGKLTIYRTTIAQLQNKTTKVTFRPSPQRPKSDRSRGLHSQSGGPSPLVSVESQLFVPRCPLRCERCGHDHGADQ